MKTLQDRLKEVALKASKPFCYLCYREAPSGRCHRCNSDDLMRLLPGVGCEYGTDWIVQALVRDHVPEFNVAAAFKEWVGEAYPETVLVAWLTVDTAAAAARLDPVSWRLEEQNWTDCQEEKGHIVSFDHGATYCAIADLNAYLDEALAGET